MKTRITIQTAGSLKNVRKLEAICIFNKLQILVGLPVILLAKKRMQNCSTLKCYSCLKDFFDKVDFKKKYETTKKA